MVYVFLAEGFEEMEAITPVDLLRRAGIAVTTVGIGGRMITGAHGITVEADREDAELILKDLDMIVLPGGNPGYKNLDASAAVEQALRQALEKDAYIAAICGGPTVLGHHGLLKGKRATVYPGLEGELTGADVVTDSPVVVDGKIITSRGAGTAVLFSAELIALLKGRATADEVLAAIVYPA